jgi:hypothetical protein
MLTFGLYIYLFFPTVTLSSLRISVFLRHFFLPFDFLSLAIHNLVGTREDILQEKGNKNLKNY